jgi:acyl-CoA thioester hydrolase
MKSSLLLRVRIYECDSYNHVNNAVYLHYLETARYEFLKDIGFDYKEMISRGYGVYVARIEIDYKKPALADEEIQIESEPVKKGAVSGVIRQTIRRGDEVIITANVTWVFVDAKGAPVKLPPEFDKAGLYPPEKMSVTEK